MTDADTPPPAQDAEGRRLPTRPRDEIASLGDAIYERDVRPRVEADHYGEIVAIDVDSGSWAFAESELAAVERLRAQRAVAVNVWLLKVGYRTIASIGGGSLRRAG